MCKLATHLSRYKLMKIHQHYEGQMTKMAAMPMYGKNTLSRNYRADFDETLYEAPETQALYYLCKL